MNRPDAAGAPAGSRAPVNSAPNPDAVTNGLRSGGRTRPWERAEALARELSPAELDELPTDVAEQHDHYAWGVPQPQPSNPSQST